MSSLTRAVLLAAGRGSRLSPHTDQTPKPLLPWLGEPALGGLLDSISDSGITTVLIVTHYLAEQVNDYTHRHSKRWPLDIHCITQKELAGTADALQCAVDAKPEFFKSDFLLTATDYLVDRSFYPEFVAFHNKHRAKLSVSLKALDKAELSSRSSVRYTGDFVISEIVEKPPAGTAPSSFSANLLFVLPSSIVTELPLVEPSPRGEKEIQSAINRWIINNMPARGLVQKTPQEWGPELADLTDAGHS